MALSGNNSGLSKSFDPEKRFDPTPNFSKGILESVVAALLKRFAPEGITTISVEELIDAPDMEARHDFAHDTYELRIRP